jgi:NAD(P)-dependent dehydrogenase (short-subunit alcohol dehydrogenase family)
MSLLEGKVAIIIGAAKGIGAEYACAAQHPWLCATTKLF